MNNKDKKITFLITTLVFSVAIFAVNNNLGMNNGRTNVEHQIDGLKTSTDFEYSTLATGTENYHFDSIAISGDTVTYAVDFSILKLYAHDVGRGETRELESSVYIPYYGNVAYQHYSVFINAGDNVFSDDPSAIERYDYYNFNTDVLVAPHDYDQYNYLGISYPYLVFIHDYYTTSSSASLYKTSLDLFNLDTGTLTSVVEYEISSPIDHVVLRNPIVDGRYVVWIQADDRFMSYPELWVFDMELNTYTMFLRNPASQGVVSTAINNGVLIYSQLTGDSSKTKIKCLGIATCVQWTIADCPTFHDNLQIDGDYVVWEQYEPPDGCQDQDCSQMYWESNIYLHDLGTGETTRVTNEPGRQFFPEIKGDRIVYVDNSAGIMELKMAEFIARPPEYPESDRAQELCYNNQGDVLLDETFVRGDEWVHAETRVFGSMDAEAETVLCIRNGDINGDHRTKQATIWINGVEVISGILFNGNFESIAIFVDFLPNQDNIVEIEIGGIPGSKITVKLLKITSDIEDIYEIIQITNNDYDDWDPQVDNGQVVWQGRGPDHWDIFFYDSKTDEHRKITDTVGYDSNPSIHNNLITWDGTIGEGGDVFLYDVDSYTTTRITNNLIRDQAPKIHDGQIVWIGHDGFDYEIFIYNIATKITTQITDNDYYDAEPQIHNGQIVWIGHDGFDYEIFIYNIATEITTQITDNIYYDIKPQIHNGKITWCGWDGSDYEIFLFDGQEILQLTVNDYDDAEPQIHDGRVVWRGSDSSIGWSEIFLYDSFSGQTKTISDLNPNDNFKPQIHNNQVVWNGHYYDNRISYYAVFLYDINTEETIQITYNNYDYFPQLKNGYITWIRGIGGDREIFLAIPIIPSNIEPIAKAGGPYIGNEGESIVFDGSNSEDTDGDIVLYEWDFDGDLTFEISSSTPITEYTWLDDFSGSVTLRVTDNGGLTSMDTTEVIVNNLAPICNIDLIDQPISAFILPYDLLTFTGSFFDPGISDTHTSLWVFGDGEYDSGLTVTHFYDSPGIYTVTFIVIDDDGGFCTDSATVEVMSAEDSVELINEFVQNLPVDAFKIGNENFKIPFENKFNEVFTLIEAGEYEEAIDKLLNDIRAKCDGSLGGKPENDWITDPTAQQEICEMIDALVSYLISLL